MILARLYDVRSTIFRITSIAPTISSSSFFCVDYRTEGRLPILSTEGERISSDLSILLQPPTSRHRRHRFLGGRSLMCLVHAACLGILNISRGRKFRWIHFLPRGYDERTLRWLVVVANTLTSSSYFRTTSLYRER